MVHKTQKSKDQRAYNIWKNIVSTCAAPGSSESLDLQLEGSVKCGNGCHAGSAFFKVQSLIHDLQGSTSDDEEVTHKMEDDESGGHLKNLWLGSGRLV